MVAMVLALLSPRLWNARLLLFWATAIGIMLLVRGGVQGLARIETAKCGGLPVMLLLAILSLGLGFPLAVLLALGRQSDLSVVKAISVSVIELGSRLIEFQSQNMTVTAERKVFAHLS